MKKIFLISLCCCYLTGAFSQLDTANIAVQPGEKWELTPAKGIPKGKGRLNLRFPPGLDWSVDIYNGTRFIINRSIETYKLNYHDLAPGIYTFKLNTVPVENVPIEAGKETALKWGLAQINAADWNLMGPDGKKFFTSGNKSTNLLLPVGTYQLLEENNSKRVLDITSMASSANDNPVRETEYWVMTPLEAMNATLGKLSIKTPKDTTIVISNPLTGETQRFTVAFSVRDDIMIRLPNESIATRQKLPLFLEKGGYTIKLNGRQVQVSIAAGKETRLKAGILFISKIKLGADNVLTDISDILYATETPNYVPFSWKLKSGSSPQATVLASGRNSDILALSPGQYYLEKQMDGYGWNGLRKYTINISDGQHMVNGDRQ